MPKYFYCKHCRKRKLKNPRLKVKQSYCGSGACQQARKNKWEREKLKKDHVYRKYRNGVKAKWRKTRPDDVYQRNYRESHPGYEQKNLELQKSRNFGVKMCQTCSTNPNIVKTDALIVELKAHRGNCSVGIHLRILDVITNIRFI